MSERSYHGATSRSKVQLGMGVEIGAIAVSTDILLVVEEFDEDGPCKGSGPVYLLTRLLKQAATQVSASTKQGQLHQGWKEMFYLTTHSTHFIYGYMASDIW